MKTHFFKLFASFTGLIICAIVLSGCSREDAGPLPLQVQNLKATFVEVNDCHVGGGVYYTEYSFTITYKAVPGVEIGKIVYSNSKWLTPKETVVFNDTGEEVLFDLCVRFGFEPYFDFATTLVSTEGVKSNEIKVRINKPENAN